MALVSGNQVVNVLGPGAGILVSNRVVSSATVGKRQSLNPHKLLEFAALAKPMPLLGSLI